MKTKYWTKTREFEGVPELSDFKIVEEEVDENLKDGEFITEAISMSVDPFQRAYVIKPGAPVTGFQAAKVLESKNPKYPKNAVLLQVNGWKTISKGVEQMVWYRLDQVAPKLSPTYWVGVVGMPGLTAYYGLLDICQPKKGETVMVNGSAGAVGSLVGQIAKIKGCKVVGCCGSDEKVKFCKSIGFDEVFNYKTEKSWPEALKRAAPDGIDCFFDNVGGQMASDIINHMNANGRVACCGSISSYNEITKPKATLLQPTLIGKYIKMEGFVIGQERFKVKHVEGAKQMAEWVAEGKLKVRETVTKGFENIPKAFIGMLKGENIGKAAVLL